MNKILIIFLIFIFFSPAVLSLGIREIPGNIQPSLVGTQKVDQENVVSQAFQANNNGLSGIGFSIKNPMFVNKKDLTLVISQDGKDLRQITLNGSLIKDGEFTRFNFQPIKDSNAKRYVATFSAPTADRREALEIFLTDQKIDDLRINNKSRGDSLSFVTLYRPASRLSLMRDIYQTWFNRLLSDLPFFIFYGLAVSALGFLAFKSSRFR